MAPLHVATLTTTIIIIVSGGEENVEDGLFSDSDEDSYSDSIQLGNPHSSS